VATTRKNISGGSGFEEQYAYSRVVVDVVWVFVAGTTGYDYATMSISSDATSPLLSGV